MKQREAPKGRQRIVRDINSGSRTESKGSTNENSLRTGGVAGPVEIILENVRCFAGTRRIPIRPLTVLVGENSSGKSAFLASLSLVCDSRFPLNPEFNKPPYNLGTFRTIATHKSERALPSRTFSLGFRSGSQAIPRNVEATYSRHPQHPGRIVLSRLHIEKRNGTVDLNLVQAAGTYEVRVDPAPTSDWLPEEFRVPASLRKSPPVSDDWGELYLSLLSHPERKFDQASRVRQVFSDLTLTSSVSIAPIRAKPRRTYDAVEVYDSPEGDHIPLLLARSLSGGIGSQGKGSLLAGLKRFGEESGLFEDIYIRNLGDQPADPFQIMVNVGGKHTNLLDVGYCVSQVLPLVVQGILAADGGLLLLQQPEVHLHPKAQAALGSFFVDLLAQSGKCFVVETHSDYIVDRIRTDIAQGKIPCEAFLILYFERRRTETTIYSLTVDSLGNIEDAPPSYREFFLRETMSLLSRGD